ncbi:MAG: winged helix-turn-helix domain-containing protein [Anaerolineales bacterium]|nr:winged helix-turn-helix domain-containing protein [Anaerolineales bacterium]
MSNRSLIILSRLAPPAQRSNILPRERVTSLLSGSLQYPLTILQAGTGYGKSTSLLTFIEPLDFPVFWFSVSADDRDPTLFLMNLYTAFNQHSYGMGAEALRILNTPDSEPTDGLIALVNAIANRIPDRCLLILDDVQYIDNSPAILNLLNWFIDHLPRSLHVILSTRRALDFPSIHRWRAKGTVLELGKRELTFTPEEVETLFHSQYQLQLSQEEVEQLIQRTEGWVIGLQMVWQSIKGQTQGTVMETLREESESRKNLFAYLAEEVLENQAPAYQNFLIRTSILSFLDTETCDFLMDSQNSIDILNELYRSGLFLEQLRPGVYRYHHMFREFLESRLSKNAGLERELHRKIGSYFAAHQYWESAVGHLLKVGDYPQINLILENVGKDFILTNRHESLRYWIEQFPESQRALYPYVNFLLGEVNRYNGFFELALEDYRTAQRAYQRDNHQWGISLALRGQAQVYLDTIRPINANQLLHRALALLDPAENRLEVAELLTQMAENQVNQGDMEQAEQSLQRSRELSHGDSDENDFIQARLFLRTGRIPEGIELLQKLEPTADFDQMSRPQRFHREASLLLSLFYSFCGEPDIALNYARRGIELGHHYRSVFVRSVGFMRLGHALQLSRSFDEDEHEYKKIISLYQESMVGVDIARIHVEPLWGMCRLLGLSGRQEEARKVAEQALSIANSSGDIWIGMLVRLSLGASLALSGQYEAANLELSIAESIAARAGDDLSRSAALLWLGYCSLHQGYESSLWLYLEQGLALINQHHYQFLLTKPTMLGGDNPMVFLPLLLQARLQGIQPALTQQILEEIGAENLDYHPGYTLRIRTFGEFSVWRGSKLLDTADWKREKARQLLQILVGNAGRWLSRDQLTLFLWPDAEPATASNNLKVTLSSLNQALEPDRPEGKKPVFVLRRGSQYMLNPNAGISIDAVRFDQLSRSGVTSLLESAVQLYHGRYFENEAVGQYFVAEGQYYHERYLHTMDQLIQVAIKSDEWEKALNYSRTLLSRDALWEPAYRSLMLIHHRMGNPGSVLQVFQQCQQTLNREIGSGVSAETQALFNELMGHA